MAQIDPNATHNPAYTVNGQIVTDAELQRGASDNYGWGRAWHDTLSTVGLEGASTYSDFVQRLKDGKVQVDENGKVKLSFLDSVLGGISQETAQQLYERDRKSRLRNSSAYRTLVATDKEVGRTTDPITTDTTIESVQAQSVSTANTQRALGRAGAAGVSHLVNPNMTAAEIDSIITREGKKEETIKEDRTRRGDLTLLNAQGEQTLALDAQRGRREHENSQRDFDLRLAELDLKGDQLKTSNQLELARMRHENDRADRKDSRERRQDTMNMIVQGLQTLSQGFTY